MGLGGGRGKGRSSRVDRLDPKSLSSRWTLQRWDGWKRREAQGEQPREKVDRDFSEMALAAAAHGRANVWSAATQPQRRSTR